MLSGTYKWDIDIIINIKCLKLLKLIFKFKLIKKLKLIII